MPRAIKPIADPNHPDDGGSRPAPLKRREYPVRRPLKRPPVHPGALMREILDDHVRLTIAEAARRMKVSRAALHSVLNGSAAVSAEMALRFAHLTGGAPELYIHMQADHDLDTARQRLGDELGSPPPNTRRWVERRKAVLVNAVRSGAISLEEALRRYQLTEEEYRSWERSFDASDHLPRDAAKRRRSPG
jgi:addiction module HigA family antidote